MFHAPVNITTTAFSILFVAASVALLFASGLENQQVFAANASNVGHLYQGGIPGYPYFGGYPNYGGYPYITGYGHTILAATTPTIMAMEATPSITITTITTPTNVKT